MPAQRKPPAAPARGKKTTGAETNAPPPLVRFAISQPLAQRLLDYLSERKCGEVFHLVTELGNLERLPDSEPAA